MEIMDSQKHKSVFSNLIIRKKLNKIHPKMKYNHFLLELTYYTSEKYTIVRLSFQQM